MLNSKIHSWLDDHETLKFLGLLVLVALYDLGVHFADKTPCPKLAMIGVILVMCAIALSRWHFLTFGKRIR